MRILVIGDPHIPRRASEVPPIILDKLNQLSSQLFDYTFFTGDLIKAPNFIQFLKLHTKNDIFIVIGNMDYYGGNRNAPLSQKFDFPIGKDENIKIGLIHGHQISPRGDHSQLETFAIQNNLNILISGHTHKEEITLTNKKILLLNPGSVTGAWSFVASQNPSFIVLQFNEKTGDINVTLHSYDARAAKFRDSSFTFFFENNKIHLKI